MRETLDKINAAIGGIVSLLISENYFNFYFSSHKSSSLGGHFRPSKMLESAKTRPTTIIKKANTFFVLERYSWRRGSSALGGCSLSPNLSTSHWTDAFTVKAHGSSVRWERRLPAFSLYPITYLIAIDRLKLIFTSDLKPLKQLDFGLIKCVSCTSFCRAVSSITLQEAAISWHFEIKSIDYYSEKLCIIAVD